MRQLRRDGVALAYEEAGSGAPPIVLVHDLASDHTCFAPQFERFSRRHRVVATDLRGHGESDKPAGPNTVSLLADDLAWLCYELGLYRPVVLGNGLGALVALDLAARYQDLPAAIVVVGLGPASPDSLLAPVRASLRGNATVWTGTVVTADCPVPVLWIVLGSGKEETSKRLPPSSQTPSGVHSGQRSEGTLPEVINPLVQLFLSELPGRAPP